MTDVIQLKKDNILRIGIKDSNGNDTGEHLEFDMEDIELALKINECDARHRKNVEYLKNQLIIIDKKEDKKGKYILSWKEEEKIKLLNEFFKREEEALDLWLGEGSTKKLLNGRKPYYSMFEDITEMLEPIIPKLQVRAEDIISKVKNKYKKKDENVLE